MKKNSRVLKSFNNWLERTGTVDPQSGQVRDVPLLLIDDEADNASINTNAEDTDPTAINAEIRTILNRFSQASYVGITATPYANVFIMPNTDDEMFGEDLFPKDFIYTVSAPSNYFGAGRVFGEENDGGSTVELLDGDDMERYFPYKHKIDLVVEELPDSMKEAAAYFILANVIRDIRGDNTQHRSMLVHVSRFTRVQNQVAERLDDWLKQVQSDIRNFARLPAPERDKNITLRYLRFIWDKYKLEQLTSVGDGEVISWDGIAAQYLHSAAAPIMVQTVNRDSGQTGLDYSGYEKEGMRVIAIGGNSLSRGLTLEGLMVSYFYRRPLAADTLMQMGRWFGYRTNYEDLPKLWMSQDAVDWFGYLTRMDQELRFQIRNMVAANKTPRQFALAVRRDPSSLMLTAANKSRNAVDVFRPVVVTGRLLETARLRADPDTLRHNADAVKRFLKKLGSVEGNRDYSVPGYYWRNVSKEAVAELIRSFDTHPWHLSFQGPELASYVENGNAGQWWDVAFILPKDGQGVEYPDVLEHGEGVFEAISKTAKRKFIVNGDVLGVSGTKLRVGSAGAAKIGLTPAEIETAEKRFRSGNSKEHIPDSAYLIESRNPLLMIHLMHMVPDGSAAEEVAKRIPAHLFGLGLGFPMQDGEASVKTALYSVNAAQAGLFQDSSGEDI